MSNCIIDPMFFYWVSVLDNIGLILMGIGITLITVSGIFFMFNLYEKADTFNEEHIVELNKRIKRDLIIIFIGGFLLIGRSFVPSSEALTKMQLSKFATYDNTEKVISVIDKKSDELINALAKHNTNEEDD